MKSSKVNKKQENSGKTDTKKKTKNTTSKTHNFYNSKPNSMSKQSKCNKFKTDLLK